MSVATGYLRILSARSKLAVFRRVSIARFASSGRDDGIRGGGKLARSASKGFPRSRVGLVLSALALSFAVVSVSLQFGYRTIERTHDYERTTCELPS